MSENLYWLLKNAFSGDPDRPALIVPDTGVWSYRDLDHLSARLVAVLGDSGVRAGDRVLVQVDKSVEAVALYLACLRAGAVYVPINSAYTAPEVDYFIDDAEPRLFVCRMEDEERVTGRVEDRSDPPVVLSLSMEGGGSLITACGTAEPVADIAPCRGDDLAAILYTSGTTGRSKGAMLSHFNLASNAVTLIDYWGWRDDDVLLHALPIFHVHGLFIALHCAMLKATSMIFLPGFEAGAVTRHLPEATVMMGVPTFYTRLLEHPQFDREACRNMRLFVSGSAPLSEQTFEAWEARTGHRILERYGMSETMMNTSNPLDGERVKGSVGYPLPGVRVRLCTDVGQPVAPGEVGIIEVKGPNVFAGYWRLPDKTAEEFRADGYFITGDMATMDERGRITIVGRAKDLVISGGYNVYPKEVEQLLDEMEEVAESAVIGVPHPDFGEAVVAVVVPMRDDVALPQVDAALADQIARFKQPKRVVNVSELPRNAMGKVQKKQLREKFFDLFESKTP